MPKKVQAAGRPDRRKKKTTYRPATPAAQAAGSSKSVQTAATPAAATITPARSAWATTRSASKSAGTIRDEDYHYIYSDLRRIGILTALVFLVLFTLTIILK